MTAPGPAPDRDRETWLAEIEAAIDEGGVCLDSDDARDLLRAAGEGDRLRHDLAAEVERLSGGPIALRVVADRLQRLLDGGEGGR